MALSASDRTNGFYELAFPNRDAKTSVEFLASFDQSGSNSVLKVFVDDVLQEALDGGATGATRVLVGPIDMKATASTNAHLLRLEFSCSGGGDTIVTCGEFLALLTTPVVQLGLPVLANGTTSFSIFCDIGTSLQIQESDDLIHWWPNTKLVTSSQQTSFTDQGGDNRRVKFFRAVVLPRD